MNEKVMVRWLGEAGHRLYPYRGWYLLPAVGALLLARWHSHAPLFVPGLLVLALALALRAWAGRHIGAHSNGSRPQAPHLATSGPYAWLRHPLYVANGLTALGLMLYARVWPPWVLVLASGLLALYYAALALAEESRLSAVHGEAFVRYRESVPALWPRLGAHGRKPSVPSPRDAELRASDGRERIALGIWWLRQGRNVGYAVAMALLITWCAQRSA